MGWNWKNKVIQNSNRFDKVLISNTYVFEEATKVSIKFAKETVSKWGRSTETCLYCAL